MPLPEPETLLLREDGPFLHVTLNRPKVRNAMSLQMVQELLAVFEAVTPDTTVRAVILRGAEGSFCAGGDIKDMAAARTQAGQHDTDPFFELNRAFGHMLQHAQNLPQVLIAVIEGAVLGGGFGLCCVSDVAIAAADAKFGLPETGLGLPPAQIAPFVVKRIGLTKARRLALLGMRIDGTEAARVGIVHSAVETDALDEALAEVLSQIRRCAPEANRTTKRLVLAAAEPGDLDNLLDSAARDFSAAVQGPEGAEGTMAFVQKRLPNWAG